MASEYLKRKYRDVKPDEKVELTPAEKRKNWWYYNKWYVAAGVLLVLAAANLIWNWLGRGEPTPDYRIAYVGAQPMPGDTAAAIEANFAALGEDLNGDGQVLVQLRQYVSNPDTDPASVAAASVKLMADVMDQESFFFLLEDPDSFQKTYHTLSRLDGTLPEEGDDSTGDSALLWKDCPVLAGMELGDYSYDVFGGDISGSSDAFASGLFIARRGFWRAEPPEWQAGYQALWEKLLAGAR